MSEERKDWIEDALRDLERCCAAIDGYMRLESASVNELTAALAKLADAEDAFCRRYAVVRMRNREVQAKLLEATEVLKRMREIMQMHGLG